MDLRRLFEPVDNASLVFFRVAFGIIMIIDCLLHLLAGWVTADLVEPNFHFTYFGFGWVKPWPGVGMYIHFVLLAVAAGFVAAGYYYRIATALFFVGWTYTFLLDQALYLNHYYLVCLVSFLMIFLPLERGSTTAPRWCVWLLRTQFGIVYFYAGLAKLNSDWLHALPMKIWLARRADFAIIGPLFEQEWTAWLFSYGALALDLFIVPFLLWKRTRIWAFGAILLFHVLNKIMFNIGIFPFLMTAATLLYFEPDWPRKQMNRPPIEPGEPSPVRRPVVVLLAVWIGIQLLVPLRHHLYPGNVNWTEEGHRFSWHMLLRDKQGEAWFYVDGRKVDPRDHLTPRQVRKMTGRPDMILQFAHHLGARESVYARVQVSLNGRGRRLLIDLSANLKDEPRTLGHADWIRPLNPE